MLVGQFEGRIEPTPREYISALVGYIIIMLLILLEVRYFVLKTLLALRTLLAATISLPDTGFG